MNARLSSPTWFAYGAVSNVKGLARDAQRGADATGELLGFGTVVAPNVELPLAELVGDGVGSTGEGPSLAARG